MLNFNIDALLDKMFQAPKAKCMSQQLDNYLDDPAFANIEGHSKPEDYDRPEDMPIPGLRRSARRPLSFDIFMNPVKLITKKVEQVKGFKFEVTGPATHKFLMSHTWSINPQKQASQNAMMGAPKDKPATYQL